MSHESMTVGVLAIGPDGKAAAAEDGALEAAVHGLGWKLEVRASVPAEELVIRASIVDWCVENRVAVVLTAGACGLGPGDAAPEATRAVLDKDLPGLPERARQACGRRLPAAALWRGLAGFKRKTVIVNLPGDDKMAAGLLRSIAPQIEQAARSLRGRL